MDTIKQRISQLQAELIALRRNFHQHPELGYEEYITAESVSAYLAQCGIEVSRICKTGVVGLLRGAHPGKTVMLRADLDALPVTEQTCVDYASLVPGKMHACGHDAHTAMLMVAAKILAQYRDQLHGNVKFLFQPNEEGSAARDTIAEGILDNPKIDAAFALHIWSQLESGKIGISEGAVMAALEEFKATIHGKGGHTSSPQVAIDPIIAACNIVQSIQQIQTRELDAREPTVIMVGSIHAGTASNVVPDKAVIAATMRFLYRDEEQGKQDLKEKFEKVVKGICYASSTDYEIEYSRDHSPAVINDPVMVALVRDTAKTVTADPAQVVNYAYIAGEDFAEFTRVVPSAFYFIGTSNPAKDTCYPHHLPKFNIDEDTMLSGVEMHVKSALNFLKQTGSAQ